MSEQLTDEQIAQRQIESAFIALDAIYNLHAPDESKEVWTCTHCTDCNNEVQWPCPTESIILTALGLGSPEQNEETPAE